MTKSIAKSASLKTEDINAIAEKTGNIYMSIQIVAKRAKQIAVATKEELHVKLENFSSPVDNLEEIFENKEQIEISKFYERMPKPTNTALDEFMEDKVLYRVVEEQPEEDEDFSMIF